MFQRTFKVTIFVEKMDRTLWTAPPGSGQASHALNQAKATIALFCACATGAPKFTEKLLFLPFIGDRPLHFPYLKAVKTRNEPELFLFMVDSEGFEPSSYSLS